MSAKNSSSSKKKQRQVSTRLISKYLIRETLGIVLLGAVLFVSAGTINWPMGWALVVLTALWVAAMSWILITRSPDLIAERLSPKEGTKSWDVQLMGYVGILEIARTLVAGMDYRFGWSSFNAPALQIAALAVAALGIGLVVWAMYTNAFFSNFMRVQKERGHQVATSGPYRFVRHPAYLGSVLFELAVPVMLGSWLALIPGALAAILFIIRASWEDRTLYSELTGYKAYAKQTRYIMLPWVW
jgi:protein-S-isoprenylcysteine O-methyltransferase Ste14